MSLNYDNYNNAFNKAWKGANSMDPLSAGAIASGVIAGASAIGSGITGLVNNEYNKKQNEWNKQFAREQWEYQKYANENAVQIRARDLEAAGLSKQLAAGSASGNVAGVSQGASGNADTQVLDKDLLKTNIVNDMSVIQARESEKDLNDAKAIVAMKEAGLISKKEATEVAMAKYYDSMKSLNNWNEEYARFWQIPSGLSAKASNKWEAISSVLQFAVKYFVDNVGAGKSTSQVEKEIRERIDKQLKSQGVDEKDRKIIIEKAIQDSSALNKSEHFYPDGTPINW